MEIHSETLSTTSDVKTINPLLTDPNPDPRILVQAPECDPEFSPIGTVTVLYDDGETGNGTGFLISNNIVVTAAHVIHTVAHPGPPRLITFTPSSGPNQSAPFGNANGVDVVIPQQYVANESPLYDYAAFKIDAPLGVDASANHFGLRSPDASVLSTSAIRIAGYPLQAQGVSTQNMWSATSHASLTNGGRRISYNLITSSGQSGSPIVLASDPRYVIGIATHAAYPNSVTDSGVFFTAGVLDFFNKAFTK